MKKKVFVLFSLVGLVTLSHRYAYPMLDAMLNTAKGGPKEAKAPMPKGPKAPDAPATPPSLPTMPGPKDAAPGLSPKSDAPGLPPMPKLAPMPKAPKPHSMPKMHDLDHPMHKALKDAHAEGHSKIEVAIKSMQDAVKNLQDVQQSIEKIKDAVSELLNTHLNV